MPAKVAALAPAPEKAMSPPATSVSGPAVTDLRAFGVSRNGAVVVARVVVFAASAPPLRLLSANAAAADARPSSPSRIAPRRFTAATVSSGGRGAVLQGESTVPVCARPASLLRCRLVTCRSLAAGPCRSQTGSFRGRLVLLLLALPVIGLAAAAPALGTSPIDQKKAEAQQVYNQILSLDQSLGQADEKINLANLRLQQVQYQQKVNHRELIVARRNLVRSRALVVKRLLELYTGSQTSTLDLILGSTSITNLMAGSTTPTASRSSTAR